jgi:PHD/YefM family antitoxin component YafN of YafNO toxin-antitoxin module
MNVQFLSNEKGKKTAVVIPIKDWEEIQEKLKLKDDDFWEALPEHVKEAVDRGQKQSLAGETKSHEEVMQKYSKYL